MAAAAPGPGPAVRDAGAGGGCVGSDARRGRPGSRRGGAPARSGGLSGAGATVTVHDTASSGLIQDKLQPVQEIKKQEETTPSNARRRRTSDLAEKACPRKTSPKWELLRTTRRPLAQGHRRGRSPPNSPCRTNIPARRTRTPPLRTESDAASASVPAPVCRAARPGRAAQGPRVVTISATSGVSPLATSFRSMSGTVRPARSEAQYVLHRPIQHRRRVGGVAGRTRHHVLGRLGGESHGGKPLFHFQAFMPPRSASRACRIAQSGGEVWSDDWLIGAPQRIKGSNRIDAIVAVGALLVQAPATFRASGRRKPAGEWDAPAGLRRPLASIRRRTRVPCREANPSYTKSPPSFTIHRGPDSSRRPRGTPE